MQFDRLLLGQSFTQSIKIKNTCAIPVKWKLNGLEKLEKEFNIQNTSGILRPTQETVVDVTFTAIEQKEFSHVLNIEVEDNEDIGIKQEPMPKVNLHAEAFKIDVQLDPKNPENLLNFGDVRVGDSKD